MGNDDKLSLVTCHPSPVTSEEFFMPTYVFKGRNRLGEVIVGERIADSRDILRQVLR